MTTSSVQRKNTPTRWFQRADEWSIYCDDLSEYQLVPHVCPQAFNDEAFVYLLVTGGGQPLYIGVTSDPLTRFKQHGKDKPWFPRAAGFMWHQSCCRFNALRVEALAISDVLPTYNVAGIPS